MTQKDLGVFGEDMAVQLLTTKGYTIVERNYRFGKLEVDIIARLDEQLAIVEVKCRETALIGEPWKAVTRGKQKSIIKVANHYLKSKSLDIDTRFDIVSIVHNSYHTKIEHIEGAFTA